MQFMGLTPDDYYGFDESDLIDISEEEFQLIGKELKKIWVLNEDDVRTNLVVRWIIFDNSRTILKNKTFFFFPVHAGKEEKN